MEPVGAELLIHARHHAVELVSRTPVDALPVDPKQVWVDAEACRVDVFDVHGRRIGPASAVEAP